MAHGITDQDNLFLTHKPGWHGLGHVFENFPSRAEAQAIAHPWEPITEDIYSTDLNTDEMGNLYQGYNAVEGYKMTRRSDTGRVLGVVSDKYQVVSNNELWDIAEALEGSDPDVQYETGGSLMGGAKVWLLLKLKDPLVVPGDPNGATIPYYSLQNSHDGLGSLRGQATMTRIVCHKVGTPVLHDGEWIRVEDHPGVMAIKREDGLTVHLAGTPDSLAETVTLDHLYWARNGGEPGWVKARDLTKTHEIGYPIPAGSDDDLIPARFANDREDFWWAVGLFWGDGNLVGTRQVCWAVNGPEADRLIKFLRRHGYTGKGSERAGVRQITWSNKAFHEFVAPMYHGEGRGKGGREKYPPRSWEAVSVEELSALADGYFDADGSEDKGRGGRIWYSTNLESLLSLRRMLMRLGRPSLLRTARKWSGPSRIQGREVTVKRSYSLREPEGKSILSIEDGWMWSPVNLVEWAGAHEFVPLDVPETDHAYVTHFGMSHNCANTAQAADIDSKARGTEFVFRHSKNVGQRIEQAKEALVAWKAGLTHLQERYEHLLSLPVDNKGVADFRDKLLGRPPSGMASERVWNNFERDSATWTEILEGPTCEALEGTAYGLVQATIEYAEHHRRAKASNRMTAAESRFKRHYLERSAMTRDAVRLAELVAA